MLYAGLSRAHAAQFLIGLVAILLLITEPIGRGGSPLATVGAWHQQDWRGADVSAYPNPVISILTNEAPETISVHAERGFTPGGVVARSAAELPAISISGPSAGHMELTFATLALRGLLASGFGILGLVLLYMAIRTQQPEPLRVLTNLGKRCLAPMRPLTLFRSVDVVKMQRARASPVAAVLAARAELGKYLLLAEDVSRSACQRACSMTIGRTIVLSQTPVIN